MKLDDLENGAVGEIKKLCSKYGLSPIELSIHLNVLPVRLYEIMSGKRRVTIDTDLRLCKFFKLDNGHFMDLQMEYDFALTERKMSSIIDDIKTVDNVVLKGKKLF